MSGRKKTCDNDSCSNITKNLRFCSKECSGAAGTRGKRKRVTVSLPDGSSKYVYYNNCQVCGEPGKTPHSKFCSEECLRSGSTKKFVPRVSEEQKKLGMKICSKCLELKDTSLFYASKGKVDSYCKECKKKQVYQSTGNTGIQRDGKWLLRGYGLSLVQYYVLLDMQSGVCAICA